MGFCRRCGDIVSGTRCRCGGTAVAPAVAWNHGKKPDMVQDSWSKTYVSSKSSIPTARIPQAQILATGPAPTTTRAFPRPTSASSSLPYPQLKSGVTEHILATTSRAPRPPSPLKFSMTTSDPESDILPSLHRNEPSLSKVYGSVLQPKESLTMHSCSICSTVFTPDATIYPNPDPSSDMKSFLCRPCFTANGGSKGNCPSCSRPVLALKAEGGFVHSGGKYWHKSCFTCVGCFKNMGHAPMVDLLGRPSCAECFDTCLKRDHPVTPKRSRPSSKNSSPIVSNPGGLNSSYGPGRKSRESSPAIEELELRLGIVRSPESSPMSDNGHPRHASPKLPTSASCYTSSPSSPRSTAANARSPRSLRRPASYSALQSSQTEGRPVDSPRHVNIRSSLAHEDQPSPDTKKGGPFSSPISPPSFCAKCNHPISNTRQGEHLITLNGSDENSRPQSFHVDCLKCIICDKPFTEVRKGSAVFVQNSVGPCHVQCAPAEQFKANHPPIVKPLEISALDILDQPILNQPAYGAPGRFQRSIIPSKTTAMPRFGGQAACPGCQKAVSPMERGVVPGPQGTRWHSSCLVCGGKKEMTTARLLGRVREEKKKGEPGCGKKLDSAAKSDGEGGIWCRECMLLLGAGGSPQPSPTRLPLVPSSTGMNRIPVQFTGTTTIARQFTGTGDTILRQLTGGGLSPTRSISPTSSLEERERSSDGHDQRAS